MHDEKKDRPDMPKGLTTTYYRDPKTGLHWGRTTNEGAPVNLGHNAIKRQLRVVCKELGLKYKSWRKLTRKYQYAIDTTMLKVPAVK